MLNASPFTITIGVVLLSMAYVLYALLKIKRRAICPYCQLPGAAQRVKRSTVERTLFFYLPLQKYKCFHCLKSYYYLPVRQPDQKPDPQLAGPYKRVEA